jgi:hypothetical protein
MSLLEPISKKEIVYRLVVIVTALITPIMCISFYGLLPSLSKYWDTELQPFFILTNLFTSYYFYQLKRWKVSAVLLMLLTAFSVEHYEIFHNVLAVGFFISIMYPLVTIHHHRWVIWLYLSTLIILPFHLLFFEIAAISVICLYHGLVMYEVNKFKNHH